jgi:hypothetical protein
VKLVFGNNAVLDKFPFLTPGTHHRGGILLTADSEAACYYPQYDATWLRTPFQENWDNQRPIDEDDLATSLLYHLCSSGHELGHRMINIRTCVGLIHLTFTMIKIVQLFHWTPKYPAESDRQIKIFSRRARAFFSETQIWDETYGVIYTLERLSQVGQIRAAALYKALAIQQYPYIREPIELIDALSAYWHGSAYEKAMLIRSIFDWAADINPADVISGHSEGLSGSSNVDYRFITILKYCYSQVKSNPLISTDMIVDNLVKFLYNEGIAVVHHSGHNDQEYVEAISRTFNNIAEDFLDGFLFIFMYRTIVKQIVRDMNIFFKQESLLFRETGKGFPLSVTTLRPDEYSDSIVVITRSKLITMSETYRVSLMTRSVTMNVGRCFIDFLHLGIIADLVLNATPNANVPNLFGCPQFKTAHLAARYLLENTGTREDRESIVQKKILKHIVTCFDLIDP